MHDQNRKRSYKYIETTILKTFHVVDDIIKRRRKYLLDIFNLINYLKSLTKTALIWIIQLKYTLKNSWMQKYFTKTALSKPKYTVLKECYQFIGHQKFLNDKKGMSLLVIRIEQHNQQCSRKWNSENEMQIT